MRNGLCLVLAATALTAAGCGAGPPDPLRVVDSPSDVYACRPLGRVGGPVKTTGEPPAIPGLPANTTLIPFRGTGPGGDSFALQLDAMRAAALERGATHLLLSRRILRDWSYVEGSAYRCRY